EACITERGMGQPAAWSADAIQPLTSLAVARLPVRVDPDMLLGPEQALEQSGGADEEPSVRRDETTVSTTEHVLGQVDDLAPTEPELYRMQVTIPKGTHDKLRHAQALLSHAVSLGDVAQVLDRALDVLIRDLERKKYGVPRNAPRRFGLS